MVDSNLAKICFLKTKFVLGTFLIFLFSKVLGCGFFRCKVVHCFDVEIEVPSINLYPIIFFMKQHSLCLFNSIIDIACSDMPYNKYRYTLNYNLIATLFFIYFRNRLNLLLYCVNLPTFIIDLDREYSYF